VVVTGFTAAVALGAPIGTALGGLMGWRATVWFTALLAVAGFVGVLSVLPRHVAVDASGTIRERLRPLTDRRVLVVLTTTFIGFTAVFIPYTYIGVIFEPVTGDSSLVLAALMFTGGVAGAVGNGAAGVLADRFGGSRVVAVALLWLTAGLVTVPLAVTNRPAAFVVVAFYVIGAFAITTPQQHRLIALRPDAAAVVISLNQAVSISRSRCRALPVRWAFSGLARSMSAYWLQRSRLSRSASPSSGGGSAANLAAARERRRPLMTTIRHHEGRGSATALDVGGIDEHHRIYVFQWTVAPAPSRLSCRYASFRWAVRTAFGIYACQVCVIAHGWLRS
jgi:MFS family permease